jgi:UDP-galactopyranose mutase
MRLSEPKLIIVGAGLFGLTVAERCASVLGWDVLVVDRRNHVGGNCHSYDDPETGIQVHPYGPHVFHSNSDEFWNYIQKFTDLRTYKQQVWTSYKFPDNHSESFVLPFNLYTLSSFFHSAFTPNSAKKFIDSFNSGKGDKSKSNSTQEYKNLYDKGVDMVGKTLFEALIQGYTERHWGTKTTELLPEYLNRLDMHFTYHTDFFYHKKSALPRKGGYAGFFDSLLRSCQGKVKVELNTNYNPAFFPNFNGLTLYTGPIDSFFNASLGKLDWRSLRYEIKVLDINDYQGCPQMNFANVEIPFNRITEFKHYNYNYYQALPSAKDKTVISIEYPIGISQIDEPYYPVNSKKDRALYKEYLKLSKSVFDSTKTLFGGRLGQYKYYTMDDTVLSALQMFELIRNLR